MNSERSDPTKIQISIDSMGEEISGVTRHGGLSFRAPLISHITGNLYVGGCVHGAVVPDGIQHVISLYPWEKYALNLNVKSVLEYTLYDSLELPEQEINQIVDWAYACFTAGPTLVHCQSGLNRSSLIAAWVLMREGMEAREAIELLRKKRSTAVLCNPRFHEWLLEQ